MDDVVQGNYVFVFELFHKRDFADGGAGGTLFAVEVNFFQGDEFACLAITPFEDLEEISAIGADRQFEGKALLLHRFPRPATRSISEWSC